MSISIAHPIANGTNIRSLVRALVPLLAGAGAYLIFLSVGEILLRDSDTLWQIRIGQWIVEHGAMPYTDVHSFTRFGEPWMSSSWLSQVLYAISYGWLDWAGPVILTSLAIGATVAIFMYLLDEYVDPARAVLPRDAGGADIGDPLPGAAAHAGVPVHGGVPRRADGGSRSPQGAVMAVAAGAGAVGQSARRLRAGTGADRTDRAGSALDQRGQGPRGACRAMGAVRHRRTRGLLLHALWLGHAVGRGENSQPRQAADVDPGMDADQFRHLDLLRIFHARTDRASPSCAG